MTAPVRRIVALRAGALGDTLLAFPALALLRRLFPNAQVSLVARRDVLPLALSSGLADVALPYDLPDWSALFAADVAQKALSPLARATLVGADGAIVWLTDAEGIVARNLRALGIAYPLVVSALPPAPVAGTQPEHVAHYLLRTVGELAAAIAPDQPVAHRAVLSLAPLPSLTPPAEDVRTAMALWAALGLEDDFSPVMAIHPGSAGEAKRWPAASFAALIALARAQGLHPLLIEGPQDAPVTSAIFTALHKSGAEVDTPPVIRNVSLGTLAALLRRCAVYVGNDSGPSHLAGLLDLPTIALFGPTDPAVWAPIDSHVTALLAPNGELARLTPGDVQYAIMQAIDWSPHPETTATSL